MKNKEKNNLLWRFIKGISCAFIMMAGLLVASCTSANNKQDVIVLKLGHVLPEDHPVHLGMVHMQKALAKKSAGKLKLEIFPNAQLGGERELIEQVQIGSLAITKTSTAVMENFVEEFGVYAMPYLFEDAIHYWKVLDDPKIGGALLKMCEQAKLVGLNYYDAGSRSFYTTKKLVKTPADLQGLKIRVMKNNISMKTVEALGGSPTPISYGELFTALQQGVVDGAENNPPSFYTSKHYEVSKYYTLDHHSRIPDILVMSKVVYDKLSPELQQIVLKAANESSEYQRKLWKQTSAELLDKMKLSGVQIENVDINLFKAKVKPLYDSVKGTKIGGWVETIQAKK